jgi:RHS repeat-associated protein
MSPLGQQATTSYQYNATGDLISVALPDGSVLNYEYDGARRLIAISNIEGERIELSLNLEGRPLQELIRDAQGNVIKTLSHQYDELNRKLSTRGSGGQTHQTSYDKKGNPVSLTDGNDNTTVQGFDALDRMQVQLGPLGHSVVRDYDDQGRVSSVTDPRGLLTSYQYDGLGNLVSQYSPDTGSQVYTYDEAGNRISAVVANGVSIRYDYDALNRVTFIDYEDDSHDISLTYDVGDYSVGRLSSISEAGSDTHFAYDYLGNVRDVTVSRGSIDYQVAYQRDASQRLLALTYPSGIKVIYSRDAGGEIRDVALERDGTVSSLALGIDQLAFGPLSGMHYGNGIELSRVFDLDYQIVEQSHASLVDDIYQYDANGNITDRSGNSFAYDELNRLMSAELAAGDITYSYDETGNRTSYNIRRSTDVYEYDADSNHLMRTSEWEFEYDANGNQVGRWQRDGSGDGLAYTYDQHNRMVAVRRLETVTSGKGKHRITEQVETLVSYDYNAFGQRVSKTSNGVLTNYVYGINGKLIAESDGRGDPIRDYVYLEDMPLAVVDYTIDTTSAADGEEAIMDNGDSDTSTTGTWEESQNRKAYQGSYLVSDDTGATHAWNLGEIQPGQYEVFARWPSSKKQNRSADYTITHSADVHVTPQDQSQNGNQWVSLGVFDFDGGGSEYVELSDSGGKTAADAIRLVALNPPVETSPGSVYYVHNDHLGTPQVITDEDQTIVWSANYQPFGDVEITTAIIANNLRFPGQYYDEESGLHYNYFRDYDPSLGRYVQSDPIGLQGGLNTYAYVDSNPTGYTDPHGLVKWTGSQTVLAVVPGGGAVRYAFSLKSECVKGQQAAVKVVAGGFAVGIGLDVSGTYAGEVTFEDYRSAVDPLVFDGQARYANISYALGFLGYGFQLIQLGEARAVGGGYQFGYDSSLHTGIGVSTVVKNLKEECDCVE